MNRSKGLMLSIAALLVAGSTLAGCAGNASGGDKANDGGAAAAKSEEKGKPAVNLNEPVSLLFKSQFDDSMEKFNERYGDKIHKKFPNVTVNFIPRQKDGDIVDLIAAGTNPDIMYGNTSEIDQFLVNTGLAYDLTDLIKKTNYDVNRFEPALIDNLKNVSAPGKLYGLPMPWAGAQVMYYNKALFDKFGVAYPKDGMTWDDTYDLAKKMTRVDGDQTYRGFSSFISAVLRDNQLSVPYLDPHADKMADFDSWKRIYDNLARFYEIPGNNRDTKSRSQTVEYTAFDKGNVAMQVNQFNKFPNFPEELNWDMASVPVFKEGTKAGSQAGSNYWFITSTNKHKDISFEILKFLLSDEEQLDAAKTDATIPSLKSDKVDFKAIGQEVPALKGKHVQAVYYYAPAKALPRRDANLAGADPNVLKKTMEDEFNRVVIDKIDVNTVLREVQEKFAQAVDAQKNGTDVQK